ncbi:MAG: DUF2281 domain-containing protein [Pseudomonadota bacterium]
MKTTPPMIDPSVLPEEARRELQDFYRFLVNKYVKRRTRSTKLSSPSPGTAGALAASAVVGIWKDRELGDSSAFARSLREKAQKRGSA